MGRLLTQHFLTPYPMVRGQEMLSQQSPHSGPILSKDPFTVSQKHRKHCNAMVRPTDYYAGDLDSSPVQVC